MPSVEIANVLSCGGCVVGAVHTPAGLREALRLRRGAVDFLEIRADAFAGQEARLLAKLPALAAPLIVTARHPLEGGGGALSAARRVGLQETFLPHAALIDVELRSLGPMQGVIRQARAAGVGVILSHHDFKKTPSAAVLRKLALRAAEAGADVFKVAAFTGAVRDLRVLLDFLDGEKRVPLSVMGMGPFGKISRLLFARAGSVLNYGFLDQSQVAGQWPAGLLKERIAEITSGCASARDAAPA